MRSNAGASRRPTQAADLPVAVVAVDVSLPHLDRLFDYLVPERFADAAVPGCRVRVRFSGQLVDGFLVSRRASSEHAGRLAFLERVVSPEVVLTPEVFALARATADRWAGTLADVLRLAVPPRHAAAEADGSVAGAAPRRPGPGAGGPREAGVAGRWPDYRAGPALLDALASGGSPRAAWVALPGGATGWAHDIAAVVEATAASGRGALVVVPDSRDAAAVDAALAATHGPSGHVVLTADLGPAERYRRFLAVARGVTRIVVGTRAAAFAPVHDLGLVVVWDDGDDLHAEPRAPYPHAREVLLLRAHVQQAAAIVGGLAMTAEAARLVDTGWARLVQAERATVRASAPLVRAAGDAPGSEPAGPARLPTAAWRAARAALRTGAPVLVSVPRRGYAPVLACARCRGVARCTSCSGPLASPTGAGAASCRWCGRLAGGWRCRECGGQRFRALVVGVARTTEELGSAFPGVPVRSSAQGGVLASVPDDAALVVATPGAEPIAPRGYGAALLLDGWELLTRPDLRAGEEALRRWLNAAALVRPARDGGRVVVVADGALQPMQALIRWAPADHAQREYADRARVRLPPAVVLAEITGDATAVARVLELADLPAGVESLGPVPVPVPVPGAPGADTEPHVRVLLRAERRIASDLAAALREAQGVASARRAARAARPARVRIDPVDVG